MPRNRPLVLLALAAGTASLPSQSIWINPNPTPRPSTRCCAGMASDLVSGVVWLYGGGTGGASAGDTWSWNGATWTQHSPAQSPPGRYGHAMVMDLARNRVVMFGGRTATGIVSETWEWDGVNWTQAQPTVSPSARYEHAMAYDLARNRTVLFGGSSGSSDTWEYDGQTWIQASPANVPPGRRGHSMAYLLPILQTVLFGGSNLNDTWHWDGVDWQQQAPSNPPSGRIYFSMCEDQAQSRLVLFSGRPNYSQDTWEYDGAEWTQRQPSTSLPGRSATGMAYDPNTGGPVLFGGITLSPTVRFDETWLFQGASARFVKFGGGCAGSVGTPELEADAPWLGSTWQVQLTNLPPASFALLAAGLSTTTWAGGSLPFDLGAFGLTGCFLHVSPDSSTLLGITGGTATLTTTLPNSASLAGATLNYQGFALDPGVNPAGAIVTNAATATFAML